MSWLASRRTPSALVRATAAFVFATTVACASVVIDPNDDDDQGGSVVQPPSQGGFSSGGGVAVSGGSPSTGGAGGDGGGGSTSTGMPTNPDPECVPNLELPAGEPVVLGTGLLFPMHLALAGDHVYVTEFTAVDEPGFLTRVPKTGGELERVVAGLDRPWHITASGESVYWTNSAFNGSVQRFSDADGSTSVIQNLLTWPYDITIYDGQLYVTEESGIKVLPSQSSGTIETIPSPFYAGVLAVDETGVYASVFDAEGWAPDAIVHIDNDGNATQLYSGDEVSSARRVMLDGNHLYVLGNWGASYATPVRGTRDGGPLVTLATVYTTTGDAAIADCFMYFTDSDAGLIERVPLQGGEVQVVASEQYGALGITVDDEAIWWVSSYNQTVVRLDK